MASPDPNTINPAQADPLAQLRDIHLPGAIEAWPPAPGWIALAVLAILAVLGVCYWCFRRWRRNQYRRDGLKQLDQLLAQYEQALDAQTYLANYASLLKRIALTRYPRAQVASLTGEAWVAFLDHTGSTQEFSMGAGQALVQASYERDPDIQVPALHELARSWIRRHNVRDHRPMVST